MHIIKITPQSFKIILTKEDLQRHGIEHISDRNEYGGFSGDFFAEIIEKTNVLYGCPFKEGAVDAEFFESKDGGGELFISRAHHSSKAITYLFTSEDSENLHLLCKRLMYMSIKNDSRLYFYNGKYSLLLISGEKNGIILSVLREYGSADEISKLKIWLLDEHAETIFESDAVKRMAECFT